MTDHIKFKYDIQTGAIEYEGAHGFLEATLKSLAETLDSNNSTPIRSKTINRKVKPKTNIGVTSAVNKSPSPSKPRKRNNGYKPQYNTDLNLLKLEEHIGRSPLKSNTEYIVAFVVFLTEQLKLNGVSGDDIYTCFFKLKGKVKVPNNFVSMFKNAQNRNRMIKYNSGYTNITLTTEGTNLYHYEILKRDAVETNS
ncbi:MAG: hypothetical protein L3J04_05435 [Robiginitomaculum sp.]|nr:hypothetical protein [Robiginitomaculum sp.]